MGEMDRWRGAKTGEQSWKKKFCVFEEQHLQHVSVCLIFSQSLISDKSDIFDVSDKSDISDRSDRSDRLDILQLCGSLCMCEWRNETRENGKKKLGEEVFVSEINTCSMCLSVCSLLSSVAHI